MIVKGSAKVKLGRSVGRICLEGCASTKCAISVQSTYSAGKAVRASVLKSVRLELVSSSPRWPCINQVVKTGAFRGLILSHD